MFVFVRRRDVKLMLV